MNVELLLQELSLVSKKFELINKKTGGYFNVQKNLILIIHLCF